MRRYPSRADRADGATPVGARSVYRLGFMGAARDTGNLGVSALHEAAVAGVARNNPSNQLTAFDNGLGSSQVSLDVDGSAFQYQRQGLRVSRRFYRPESLQTAGTLARCLRIRVPLVRAIDAADAVLDITGGDSFTDLYGPERFRASLMSKELVLERRRPLVLLPQTYGPFGHQAGEQARAILRQVATAWARDADSYSSLVELLGADFDPDRHREGVDIAFALPVVPVANGLPSGVRKWLDDGCTVVGLNVSGLVYNDANAADRFGLSISYRSAVDRIMSRLLRDSAVRVLLVPHVYAPLDHVESDQAASLAVIDGLSAEHATRVAIASGPYTASQVKWVISHLHWFCGTRMHATIAALSTSVPCATVAYSSKARGVFASCGQSHHVADARSTSTDNVVEIATRSFADRAETAAGMTTSIPPVVAAARAQFGEILRLGVDGPVTRRDDT